MKKLLFPSILILLSSLFLNCEAKPVSVITAKKVATNFYSHETTKLNPQLTVAYIEYSSDGQPVYYAFNVNNNDGFVIISAEYAAHPILGYSDVGKYMVPTDNNNFAWWMNCRKQEIEAARKTNIDASPDVELEWNNYKNNNINETKSAKLAAVNPLVQSMWNQSPYYNAMCPGGSVTGCVATAMAQVMRYWSYPPHGHGFSCYVEHASDGYWGNYGYLEADYDTSNYVWSAMPYSISANNYEIAKLMYDCGVSVDMDYSPGESGAWVISGDYPVCSQNSYVKYFGYNANTIQGIYRSNYTLANWTTVIENELYYSRPVQYVGNDSINNAGHTWVCDGFNSSNPVLFHMNWGWGGGSNGYFNLSAIDVAGYHFNWWDEAVIGIEPPPTSAYFSGTPTFGCPNLKVRFSDSSIGNFPITSYKWLFPGGTPSTSTSDTQTVVYSAPGTYDVTEIVSNINGTDTLTRKAYISVASTGNLPLQQGFQTAVFPPSGWSLHNPNGFSYTWQLNTTVGGHGKSTQSMWFNNTQLVADFYTIYTGLWVIPPPKPAIDIIGQRQQIYSPEYSFVGISSPRLIFDVAYAPYNTIFSDTLAVYYSTDCGNTFHQVYVKGGMTLCTTGNMVTNGADTNAYGIFVPKSADWRTDTIHIPAIAGANSVMFSFENRSGNGAAMYIDNIYVPGIPTSTNQFSDNTNQLSVYPNPGNGLFTIQSSMVNGQWSVEVYNMLGEKIFTSSNSNTGDLLTLDLRNQSNGVYLYKAITEDGSVIGVGKLVIQK